MREHDTGIVGVPVDPGSAVAPEHGLGQPAAIGQFGQEGGTGAADFRNSPGAIIGIARITDSPVSFPSFYSSSFVTPFRSFSVRARWEHIR